MTIGPELLGALVFLAPLLTYFPMASIATMLIVVAWNMSEAPKSLHLIKSAPLSEIIVFLTCLFLTVFFDMVIAITTGILLSAVLFMKEIAALTTVKDITNSKRVIDAKLPEGWYVYKITGPLFFAAADRVFGELAQLSDNAKGLIIYLDGVPFLDSGGVSAMNKLIQKCKNNATMVLFADLQFQPLKTLARAKIQPVEGVSKYFSALSDAMKEAADSENIALGK